MRSTKSRRSRGPKLIAFAFALAGAPGCISVPEDVRADLAAPDGRQPNNYGRLVENAEGLLEVVPDRPTIPAHPPEGT